MQSHTQQLASYGYSITEALFTTEEVALLLQIINQVAGTTQNFRKTKDLFAIRNVLGEIPDLVPVVFNENLQKLLRGLVGADYFLVKSIYFDKPPLSNWAVYWHQDLMILVDQRTETDGFRPWTFKDGQHAVLRPLSYLENMLTVRIHLDDCTESNGSLRVITGSHASGILSPEQIQFYRKKKESYCCEVSAGGLLLMKPLVLHASSKSAVNAHRRVLHLEFSSQELPFPLQWRERRSYEPSKTAVHQ